MTSGSTVVFLGAHGSMRNILPNVKLMKSLEAALRQLGRPDSPGIMSVDGVCKQEDILVAKHPRAQSNFVTLPEWEARGI